MASQSHIGMESSKVPKRIFFSRRASSPSINLAVSLVRLLSNLLGKRDITKPAKDSVRFRNIEAATTRAKIATKGNTKTEINAGAAQLALALTRKLSIKTIKIMGKENTNKNLFS